MDSQDIILYIYAKIRLSPEISFLSFFLLLSQNTRKSEKTPFHIRGHIYIIIYIHINICLHTYIYIHTGKAPLLDGSVFLEVHVTSSW